MSSFIEYPKVYVIGRLTLEMNEVHDFLDEHDTEWSNDLPFDGSRDLELAAEFAGRQCYDAFGAAQYRKDNASYIENIVTQAHGSVLEHPTVMLLITGVSRSLTHELIRHRVGVAYSQRSQRYVDETKAQYVVPSLLNEIPEARGLWEAMIKRNAEDYAALAEALIDGLKQKFPNLSARERRIQARQAARSILPNAIETRIVVTANMRTLRHICEVRGGIGAEAEIRRLACVLTHFMKIEAPNIFYDMSVEELEDGELGVVVKHHKV